MRNCEYVGIPSLFQGRVQGVGDVRFSTPEEEARLQGEMSKLKDEIARILKNDGTTRLAVCHPKSPTGTCKPVDWNPDVDAEIDASFAKYQQEAAARQKKVDEMKSWRSNTPIASWTSPNASGVARTINVYGYNKEIGYVWLAEGPSSSAANSQLFPEYVLASKFPEWVAWKSGSTSGLPLPLLLGAAYLLLA